MSRWQRYRGGKRRAVLIGVVVVALMMTACGSSRNAAPPTSSGATTTTATSTTAVPTSRAVSTTAAPTSASTATTAPASTSLPPAGLGSYLPLFPFADAAEVATWEQQYRTQGSQPWHLDAGQTAVAFAAWLSYPEITTVIATRIGIDGAHVSIGFHPEGTASPVTSAVVHLLRWGTASTAPWEVVGTDDTTFSLTGPAYGSTVHSPITASGTISGVDENIRVEIKTHAGVVGSFCCQPAGGADSPWSVQVSYAAAPGSVLTIAAETGGHVTTVERFTVTGAFAG